MGTNPTTADDFTTDDLQLNITDSETTRTDDIVIRNDNEYESDETFRVELTLIDNTSGTVVANADTVTVTVQDNDCKLHWLFTSYRLIS